MKFSTKFVADMQCVLEQNLNPDTVANLSPRLMEAMRYGVLDGGKYIRPALVYASAQAVHINIPLQGLHDLACAIEFIHAYSLIHDDLPAMDNDSIRRGKPACHVRFGEGIAILAGDALQVRAFELLSNSKAFSPQQKIKMLSILSRAIGIAGMAGGQAIDLLARDDTALTLDNLEHLHHAKTGSLIRAAVLLGALAAGATTTQYRQLQKFSEPIGLAFQLRDDLLDFAKDLHNTNSFEGAPSYPMLAGVNKTQQKIEELYTESLQALKTFGDNAEPLRTLAKNMALRTH